MTTDELKGLAFKTLEGWIEQGLSPADAGEATCYLHALVWVNSQEAWKDAEAMMDAHRALFMYAINHAEPGRTLQ